MNPLYLAGGVIATLLLLLYTHRANLAKLRRR